MSFGANLGWLGTENRPAGDPFDGPMDAARWAEDAGHMPLEHQAVGLPFPPYQERLDTLDAFATELAARLADPDFVPRPRQSPVPLILAAMSQAGLDVAARHGETVALSGLLQVKGAPGVRFMLASAAQTGERVERARTREAVGLPPARFDALLQRVVVDRDPLEAAAEYERYAEGRITAAAVLDSPFVLLAATPEEAAAELLRRRDRWGISSWCTHPPSGPALAQVIQEARKLEE